VIDKGEQEMERTTNLVIDGMSCGACVKGVTTVLSRLDGVSPQQVEVGSAVISYDDARITPIAITEALTAAGYPARTRATGQADAP